MKTTLCRTIPSDCIALLLVPSVKHQISITRWASTVLPCCPFLAPLLQPLLCLDKAPFPILFIHHEEQHQHQILKELPLDHSLSPLSKCLLLFEPPEQSEAMLSTGRYREWHCNATCQLLISHCLHSGFFGQKVLGDTNVHWHLSSPNPVLFLSWHPIAIR